MPQSINIANKQDSILLHTLGAWGEGVFEDRLSREQGQIMAAECP